MNIVHGGMNRVSGFLDLRVEPRMLVGRVVHGASCAVSFKQLVVALNFVTVTFLSLLLDVVGV
jgi:hypothetical protein